MTRKILLGVLVVTLAGVSVAGATHVFDDVPDDKFYAVPVDWASTNGITTGTSPTTFDPERGVTRGESVTFLWRYDDSIVQPALGDRYTKAEVDAAIAAAAPEVYHASVNADGTTRTGTSAGVTVTSHTPASGFYEIEFPPTDIRGCIFHSTLVGEPVGFVILGPVAPSGEISLAEDWDGFLPASPDPDSIVVRTADSTGAVTDYSFHVTVHC